MSMSGASQGGVLVVEDDNDIREALVEILRAEGYRVCGAADGREGLERLRSERPMLVLLDLMMPVMNGWQFRREQQLDPDVADIPVVVISADVAAPLEGMRLGARAVMQKPIELRELLFIISRECPSPDAPAHH